MRHGKLTRREFVKTSMYGLALAAAPMGAALGQTLRVRQDWDTFKTTSQYASFVNAIAKMRSNTNASDLNSWAFWANAHQSYCPHSVAYFLAWHRGFLYYFEQRLRIVSGDSSLNLPYWNYYKNSRLPAEFTNSSSSNPLYTSRVNTNVYQALTLAPFSSKLTNFPRGMTNAYEPSQEGKPHNPVHDIIGSTMATMKSPLDPIFWLHHANCDRLWNAWVAAGGGRQMPSSTSSYWSGSFTYGGGLGMSRLNTINTRTKLGYYYQNETQPTALPNTAQAWMEPVQLAMAGGMDELAALGGIGEPAGAAAPQLLAATVSAARQIGQNRRSVGGVKNLGLDEKSVGVRIALGQSDSQSLQNVLRKASARPFGPAQDGAEEPYTAIKIVLDDLTVSALGKQGGYFYDIYLNLPASHGPDERYLIGNVGPFQIDGALHHGGSAQLAFPATQVLKDILADDASELTVSFVRVSGDNSPKGPTIAVGEVRVELTDDVE